MSIARLQRALVFALCGAALLWAVWALRQQRPALALLGVLTVAFGHATVLAAEFVLLARVNRDDPAPRPTASELWRAWIAETWAALVVFGWRQPFRWHSEPDHLSPDAQGRRGVLLVHGFVCNRGLWNPWMRRLRAAGVPYVALNLEPPFGPIERYAPIVAAGVRHLSDATGLPPLVVAHSMGGLAVRDWLAQAGPAARVHAVITLGSPHRGTWLARFAFSANARQMQLDAAWLRRLEAREAAVAARPPFTCWYGPCDNIVFPPSTATLPGADNRLLRGVAHVRMVYVDAVFDDVMRRLDRMPAA